MPASVSLNTNDPVLAARNLRNRIFRQLQERSPFLATIFGLAADRKANGEEAQVMTVESFEVLQRDIEIANITDSGNIAPSASISTAISKTVPTLVRALYGGLTLNYGAAPMSLAEYIVGGPGARNPLKDIYTSQIVNKISTEMLDSIYSDGSGANADGLQKWTSKTANKWGLDTSAAANGFYRGQVETVTSAAFDMDWLSDFIKQCREGVETVSAVTTYSDMSSASLMVCDFNTFQRIKKWMRDKQSVNQTDLAHATPGDPTQVIEWARLGGFYKNGIQFDEITILPDLGLNRLRDTNVSVGEFFVIDPRAFEFIFLKGFDFTFMSDPDSNLMGDKMPMPTRDFADVVWGKYCVLSVLWNIFCEHCRNQGYGQITA